MSARLLTRDEFATMVEGFGWEEIIPEKGRPETTDVERVAWTGSSVAFFWGGVGRKARILEYYGTREGSRIWVGDEPTRAEMEAEPWEEADGDG